MPFAAIRSYSAPAKLSKDEVEGRIIELLKGFDKVRLLLWRLPGPGGVWFLCRMGSLIVGYYIIL